MQQSKYSTILFKIFWHLEDNKYESMQKLAFNIGCSTFSFVKNNLLLLEKLGMIKITKKGRVFSVEKTKDYKIETIIEAKRKEFLIQSRRK